MRVDLGTGGFFVVSPSRKPRAQPPAPSGPPGQDARTGLRRASLGRHAPPQQARVLRRAGTS